MRYRKVDVDKCVVCHTPFEKTGVHSYNAAGKCRKCYGSWIRENGHTHCSVCKEKLSAKLKKPICKMCKSRVKMGQIKSDEYVPSDLAVKRFTAYSERVGRSFEPTLSFMNEVKTLLTLSKHKILDMADNFRIVNCYIEVWGYETSLDALPAQGQLELMLIRLESYYQDKKDLIYTTPKKKRKRKSKNDLNATTTK